VLCHLLIAGHAFIDGNKRVAVASMQLFMLRNGYELQTEREDDTLFRALAAGEKNRDDLLEWIRARMYPVESG
jgi:death-on-curing protein